MAVVLSIAASTAQARITYVESPTVNLPDGGRGSAKARCPRGMHVLGGGQDVFSAPREATLVTSTPFDNRDRKRAPDDGWKSTVDNFESNVTQNTLTVWAICGDYKPSYAKDAFRVGGAEPSFSERTRCGRGVQVMGGGVRVAAAFNDGAWLRSSAPFDSGDRRRKPDDGWKAAGVVEERQVNMTLTAICGSKQLKYRADTQTAPATGIGEAFADCPRGSRVVGGGVSVAEGAFGNAMTTSRPFDDGDPRARPDDGWRGSSTIGPTRTQARSRYLRSANRSGGRSQARRPRPRGCFKRALRGNRGN